MEANLVVKVDELTPDFVDGIKKVFSKDAVLSIKVEYGNASNSEAPSRAGRKPKSAAKSDGERTKRPYKRRNQEQSSDQPVARKKPGPKPKNRPAE